MGKASRRKQQDERKKQFAAADGDGRSAEDRANARAMLDALQKKLDDDALREDGFYFVNGKCVDSRKPRLSSGMKTRDFKEHSKIVSDVSIVRIAGTGTARELVLLFTFGLDCVSIWNFSKGSKLASLSLSSLHGRSICGAAVYSKHFERQSSTIFAYATHQEVALHLFNFEKDAIIPATSPAKTFDLAAGYCTGHQQAISAMTFSHDGELLATTSWDSTCMVWKVSSGDKMQQVSRKTPSDSKEEVCLALLYVLPVHEDGGSCTAFTADDKMLITCGDCTIKLWNVSNSSPAKIANQREEGDGSKEASFLLSKLLLEWQEAIPFSFSIDKSMNLFVFEESMAELISNNDWVHDHDGNEPMSLLAPAQSEDERNEAIDIQLCLEGIIAEVDSSHDGLEEQYPFTTKDNQQEIQSTRGVPGSNADVEALSSAESRRLKSQFQRMKVFDFERLFTPTLALNITHDDHCNPIPVKTVDRKLHRANSDGRLLRTFQNITEDGMFSSHTSTITDCAVAQELDLVVTVSLDKSLRYWSLEKGVVLETVRDAHNSPITCCALTSPRTCDLNMFEMLLSTGGSDNLVKLWRRNTPAKAECVVCLSGHYDAITSVAFDLNGVFLVSSSEDSTAIVWRVRPSSPHQPEVPVLDSVERFSISISWTEPLANGSRILYYIVRTTQISSFTGDGSDIKAVPDTEVPSKYLSKTIDKLQPGVQYTLQVAAVNEIGDSPFSVPTEAIETLAFTPSRVDRPVQPTERQATRITLSWMAPCPNGAPILTYTIRCQPENSMLVPLRELTIPVADLHAQGISSAYRDVPRQLASMKSGLSLLTVDQAGGIAIKAAKRTSKYTEPKMASQARTGDSQLHPTRLAAASLARVPATLSYTVDDLWPGEVYQFVVAASNRCGTGEFSRVSEYVKMDCMAPDQPLKPMVLRVGKKELVVQWEKPRCNGSEILQYSVRWRQTVENGDRLVEQEEILLSRSIVGTKHTISGLEPGSPVQVWVSASNLVDNKLLTSLESPPADAVCTLCDVPDTPAAPTLSEPSAHTMTISWMPPKRNGLPIDSYEIALYSEDTQFGVHVRQIFRELVLTPVELHHVITDATVAYAMRHLRGGTFYSATVSARNTLGLSRISSASIPVQTKAPTVPDSVVDAPVVSDVTPTSALVSWKLPVHDGGAALQSFHVEYSVRLNRSDAQSSDTTESGGDITVSRGLQLNATFLKSHRVYRFRVSSENRVGRAIPSSWSEECATPSLVEFTVTRYFAHRPVEEHSAARFIQRRYRAWRQNVVMQARYTAALVEVLRHWHF